MVFGQWREESAPGEFPEIPRPRLPVEYCSSHERGFPLGIRSAFDDPGDDPAGRGGNSSPGAPGGAAR